MSWGQMSGHDRDYVVGEASARRRSAAAAAAAVRRVD